jgi:hypothetical protein
VKEHRTEPVKLRAMQIVVSEEDSDLTTKSEERRREGSCVICHAFER